MLRLQEQQGKLYLPMSREMSSKTSNASDGGGALGRGRAYCLIPRDMSDSWRIYLGSLQAALRADTIYVSFHSLKCVALPTMPPRNSVYLGRE